MRNSKTKDSTTRFLIYSFIGLLIFSIIIFSLLGIYMSRKSEKTVYEKMCIRDSYNSVSTIGTYYGNLFQYHQKIKRE